MSRWALPVLALGSLVTVAAAPLVGGGEAPQQPAVRVAYVNSQLILQQTPGYHQAESIYTREVQSYQQELDRLRQQLDSTIRAYNQRAIGLSQSDRQAKEQEIRELQQQLDQRTRELTERANERERELVAPLEERVKAVIEGLRAERNLGIIFDVAAPGNGIIAADRSLDLTTTVIQRLRESQ